MTTMEKDQTYNGWTNYETWNVKLWIDNEEGDYRFWKERAEETYATAKEDQTFSQLERAALTLADELKDQFEENTPTVTGCYADLLNAALSEVNWYEIAKSLLEDYQVDKES